jgi:hypothetical protein
VRGEDAPNVAVTAIPAQNRVTLQVLTLPTLLLLPSRHRIGSASLACAAAHRRYCRGLGIAYGDGEQEEDAPRRVLWFKPMSWLGHIRSRPHLRHEY